MFAAKLHKGLSKGIPNNRCLPLDFMGYYALAGQEQDKKIKTQIRQHMISDINKRREYIKTLPVWSTGGKYNCMPCVKRKFLLSLRQLRINIFIVNITLT